MICKPHPLSRKSSCACFYDWVAGQDGRTLFGEVLE
jgi:hypothetical protein